VIDRDIRKDRKRIIMGPPTYGGTFQPLQHRSGTLRDRLHSYTKSTLGAGGSISEAVRRVNDDGHIVSHGESHIYFAFFRP
jgi:hypothetical protein